MIRMTAEQRQHGLETRMARMESRKPKNRPECADRLAILRDEVPLHYQSLVEKLAEGSRTAMVKLHCLQCVGYERSEVTRCTSVRCPAWCLRPYQKAEDDGPADPADEDDDSQHMEVS